MRLSAAAAATFAFGRYLFSFYLILHLLLACLLPYVWLFLVYILVGAVLLWLATLYLILRNKKSRDCEVPCFYNRFCFCYFEVFVRFALKLPWVAVGFCKT